MVLRHRGSLFDNSTVFSDIIYDPALGFRQERLKLTGFKTADWNGDLYAPGFVFDEANIEEWTAYTDYNVGDVVKYQANFYVANKRHAGTETFENTNFVLTLKRFIGNKLHCSNHIK